MDHGHEVHLVEFLRALNRDPALPAVARTILEHALEILPQAQSATFLSLNDEEGVFEYQAAVGYDLGELSRLKLPQDRTIQHQLGLTSPAIIRDPQRLYRDLLPPPIARELDAFPVAAFITFPILVEGKVIAYFNVNSRDDPDAFSPADLDRLQGVWEEITLAVRRARERAELADSERRFRLLFERLADAVYITSLDGTILEANPAAEKQTGYSRSELLGMNIMRDLAAEEPAITYETANERLARGEIVHFEEKKRRKDGTVFITDCAITLFEYKGKPATLSVNRDITDRKGLEQLLESKLVQLQALYRASTLLTALNRDKLIQDVVTLVRDATGADFANVLLFDEEGRPLRTLEPHGAPPIPLQIRERGFSAWIRETGQPVVIEEIRDDGTIDPPIRWPGRRQAPLQASPVLIEGGIRSLAGIPIRGEGRVIGILYVHSYERRAFTGQVEFLTSLARQVAVALENASLYATLRESEAQWRILFEESPVGIHVEDFSAVKAMLDALRGQGVSDLGAYLTENPDFIRACAEAMRLVHANRAALALYGARDQAQQVAHLRGKILTEPGTPFVQQLLAIWQGKTEATSLVVDPDVQGRAVHVQLKWRVFPGHEGTYDRVLVSLVDLTERVAAEEATARRDAVLGAVAFAAERFLRAQSLDEEIPEALARLGEAIGVSRVYLFQDHHDADGRRLASQRFEWVAPGTSSQLDNPKLQALPYLEGGFSRWEEAFSHGEPIAGPVREFPPAEQSVLRPQGILSLLAVPIFVANERWGFLGLDDCVREREWSEIEVEALRMAARTLGAAIERAKVEEDLQVLNADLRGLYEVSVALGASLDLGSVFARVYEEIAQLIPCDAFILALVDAARREFRLAYAVEEGERLPEVVHPLDPEQSLTGWIVATKRSLLVRDFEAEGDQLPAASQRVGKDVRSWLGVPLLFQDEVLGVLSVQSFAPGAYGEKDLRLLETISAPVATVIHNARTYAGLAALEEKLRRVEAYSRRMKLARDKEELYSIVLELTGSVLGYRPCVILEPCGEELTVVAGHDELAWAQGMRFGRNGKGITTAALRSREPEYAADVSRDERYVTGDPNTRSELAVPIVLGDRVFGILDVQTAVASGIPVEDRDLLNIVASELAVALAGLERLEQVEAVNERLAGLHRLVMRLSRCATVEEVCEVAAHEAVRILGFTTYTVSLVEGDWLVPKASVGIEGRPLRRGEGVAWQTLEHGRTISGNLEDLPQARPVRPDLRSVLSVPIGDFGVFQVASTARDAFSPEDVLVAEILAGHLREEIRRIRIEEQLREQAIRDPLTGLYNRRTLGGVLEREIERAKRYEHPLTLVMADIDDFKSVNDRHGHLVGDALLRRVAEVLRGSVRAEDYVFRYGGEEFVLVLPETGDGEGVLPRLRQAVRGISLPDVPGLSVSLSVGHVVWNPVRDGPTTVEALLRRADEVLYGMKRRRIHKR
ncbi:MAG: GAF domain-containing protein [Candidatus Bipolaricaulis sp.]|nr:GAF domain-containing protein [Candidatus Bipolaricaulis sp.]